MKNSLIFILITAAILGGCAPRKTAEEEGIKTVIAKYNGALIQAYKNQFFGPLKEVATEDEFNKVKTTIESFLQGEEVMEPELRGMNFKGIKIDGDKAAARTSEDWSYRWVDYRTRQEKEPRKDIHYEMLYHLIKKDGKWLVEKVEEVKGGNPSAKGRP